MATRNSNNFTYDGIDVGGERVAQETEDSIKELEASGHKIKKLSMVGYSLGGLVARYTIGLLYSRGLFDNIEPVNFTTFATPHLGVRTPLTGYQSYVWNALGGRTLSTSGRQLFLIDSFRDTGRPILSVLADPDSIFIKALSHYRNRVLYCNVVNDRSAPYYTTAISKTDPFVDPETVSIKYVKGYEPIVVARDHPAKPIKKEEDSDTYSRFLTSSRSLLSQLPFYAMLTVLVPIGSVVFLINSGVQSFRSQQRIRLHEQGKAGVGLASYRIPLMIESTRSAVQGAIENVNPDQQPNYLDDDTTSSSQLKMSQKRQPDYESDATSEQSGDSDEDSTAELTRVRSYAEFPTLALAPEQFEMIDGLDGVGFRKYPIHIHKVRHSHAAIIFRRAKSDYDEGKTVIKHWLSEEFEIR